MGGTQRQFNDLYNKFSRRFKLPFANVLKVIKSEFTNDEFVAEFKLLYPYLWNELESEYAFWKSKNDVLIHYGKQSRYDFPKPYDFLIYKSIHQRQKARKQKLTNSADQRQVLLRNEIIFKGRIKLEAIEKKRNEKLHLTQELNPSFLENMLDKYFKLGGKSQELINKKLEIIREAGNYKSPESIIFLQKVNAKEQNFKLQHFAMKMLQNMNEKVILRRKQKGAKNQQYVNADYVILDNPDTLFNKLYDDMQNFEITKSFDVFLSHSSLDRESIIGFYKRINLLGLHVYIDWVNDKFPLQRDLLNENTARAILKRLSKSKILICYVSDASIHSQWTSWEIGYFSGLDKPVLIYNPEHIILPVFLKIYPQLILTNGELFIQEIINGELSKLRDWMDTSRRN